MITGVALVGAIGLGLMGGAFAWFSVSALRGHATLNRRGQIALATVVAWNSHDKRNRIPVYRFYGPNGEQVQAPSLADVTEVHYPMPFGQSVMVVYDPGNPQLVCSQEALLAGASAIPWLSIASSIVCWAGSILYLRTML
jgi:hypothetical protein